MLELMDTIIEDKWDERHWNLALKTTKPAETYQEIKDSISSGDSTEISDLSKEEQDWLRS
jgi:hypothetical protein